MSVLFHFFTSTAKSAKSARTQKPHSLSFSKKKKKSQTSNHLSLLSQPVTHGNQKQRKKQISSINVKNRHDNKETKTNQSLRFCLLPLLPHLRASSLANSTMTQESFIYSFVARGTMILSEYTQFTGNFPAIAAQCLQKLPSSNNKFTYNCDHHTFNFLVEDGYAYCVVAKDSVGKQISIAFLERVRADFRKRYGGGKADTAVAKSLNKEFGPVMKEHMKYIIDHAEEIEKLLKVKAQVSEVKSIMLENIDKAIDRGENLTVLVDKTEDLRSQAQDYKNKGTQIRRKMWYQNMKIKLVVFGILVLLVLVIWLSICHGFDCTN